MVISVRDKPVFSKFFCSFKDGFNNAINIASRFLRISILSRFSTSRLFSWRKFLIMENIKNTPQMKSEAVIQRCSINKMFLELSQNSQENKCARVFFNKVAALRLANLVKKRLWHRCFPVNLCSF